MTTVAADNPSDVALDRRFLAAASSKSLLRFIACGSVDTASRR